MLVFDNDRLKQATYDTSQGFGLRAVKDEAVGYAHASDVSEAAIARAADAVRAVKGGIPAAMPRPRRAPTRGSTATTIRLAAPAFEAKVKLLEAIDAYARAKDERVRQVTASLGASWQVVEIVRADGETYRDIRPLVRVNVSVVAGRATGRNPAATAMAAAKPTSASSTRRPWQHAVDEAVRQALVNLGVDAGAGRRDGRGARPGLAGRHAARGGRPRPRRRLQPQEDLGLRRPDGPAGRVEGRHRGRRRHAIEAAAARSRSTTRARRPTAPC